MKKANNIYIYREREREGERERESSVLSYRDRVRNRQAAPRLNLLAM